MTATETVDRLVTDGIVDEIVQRVKTGKEAEVFVVRKGEQYLAAKVYKERSQRNFKNNVGYQEGRAVRSSRDMRAMTKRTSYGIDKAENEWMHAEHDALSLVDLHGVRVPKPELFYEGILLMELVLGPDGQPAPRLIEVPLSEEEAIAHHREIVGFVVTMLTLDLIHGDLSPYNILLAWNGPTIIDMPQVVKAAHNSQAEKFFVRDVRNVTEFFARYAPKLLTRVNDGYIIWKKYEKRELAPEFFPEEGAIADTLTVSGREKKRRRRQDKGHKPEAHVPVISPAGSPSVSAQVAVEAAQPHATPTIEARPAAPSLPQRRQHVPQQRTPRPMTPRPVATPVSAAPVAPAPSPATTAGQPNQARPNQQRNQQGRPNHPPRPQGARPPQNQPNPRIEQRPNDARPLGTRPAQPSNGPRPEQRPQAQRPPQSRHPDQRTQPHPHEPRVSKHLPQQSNQAARTAPQGAPGGGGGGGGGQSPAGQGQASRFSRHHRKR